MKASEFDKKFEKGEDISEFLDFSKSERPGQNQKRVNVDFPVWMKNLIPIAIGKEARRLGVTRQSIIKVWIAQKLEEVAV